MSTRVDAGSEAVPSSSVSCRSCGTQLDQVAMLLHRAACSMVLQRRAAAARDLYPTSPAYRSRPRPPAGRSRRVRLLIWAQRVASSRLRRIDGIVHRGAYGGAAPMPPLAAQVHAQRCSGVGTCPGSPGAYLRAERACVRCTQRACGEILTHMFVLRTKQYKKTKVCAPLVSTPIGVCDGATGLARPQHNYPRPMQPPGASGERS